MPPWASSKRPSLRWKAPVKAPFSCPNSSDSMSVSAIAAGLTATKGLSRRGLCRWIARAISSLPVPLSPVMSTVVDVRATWDTSRKSFCTSGCWPTISSKS